MLLISCLRHGRLHQLFICFPPNPEKSLTVLWLWYWVWQRESVHVLRPILFCMILEVKVTSWFDGQLSQYWGNCTIWLLRWQTKSSHCDPLLLMHHQVLSILPPNVSDQMRKMGRGRRVKGRSHIYTLGPKGVNRKAENKGTGQVEKDRE